MAEFRRQRSASRGQLQELRDERRVVREGFDFLEQKRMLIASELLRELRRYEEQYRVFRSLEQEARRALGRAIGFHGLQGLYAYPQRGPSAPELEIEERRFLDLGLRKARIVAASVEGPNPAVLPSIEAELCSEAFRALVRQAAPLAATAGNLVRLLDDYRRTERRARALENVLLPEIEEAVRDFEDQLEAMDQEDAIRVRIRRD